MGDGKVTSNLSNVWGNIVRSVTGKLPELGGEAKSTVDALEKLVADSGAPTLASRGAERLGGYMQEGAEKATETLEAGKAMVDRAVEAAVETGGELAARASEGLDAGKDLVDRLLDATVETGGELAASAAERLEAGINDALPISLNDMSVIGRNVMNLIKTGELSPEQRFLLSKLTPDASFSLAQLTAQDVGKFLKVAGAVMFGDGAKRLKAESGLLLLLIRGDLTREPPGGGKRLLDVLAERADKPVDPRLAERGMELGEALSDVIEQAAMPVIIRQGRGSSTCVAGSLQAAMAAENPAAYAEFALGLIQDGKAAVKGPDGTSREMTLDTGDIDDGYKGQDILDAAVQGSMVAFARKSVPEEGEDFAGGRVGGGGRFGGGRAGSGGRFGAGRLGGGGRYGGGRAGGKGKLGGEEDAGLTLKQADYLYENTLGRKGASVNVEDSNAEAVTKRIEEAAGSRPVQVGLQAVQADGSIGGHMLSVQGTATDAAGKPLIVVSDSLNGEVTAMPRDEFQKLLIGAILPE